MKDYEKKFNTLVNVIYNKLSKKELILLEKNIKSRVFSKIQEKVNKQEWLLIPTKKLKKIIDKA